MTSITKLYYDEQLDYVSSFWDWNGKDVLDAGVGYGRIAKVLAGKGANVTGLDINLEMINLARKHPKLKHFQIGDVEALGFRDESFDTVVCVETLMHVPQPLKAITEFARILRPKGLVFLGGNNILFLGHLIRDAQIQIKLYQWFKRNRTTARAYHHYNFIGEAKSWLKICNLKLVEEIGIGLAHPDGFALSVAPNLNVNLIPDGLARFCLTVEKVAKLRSTFLKYFMKAFLVVGQKR